VTRFYNLEEPNSLKIFIHSWLKITVTETCFYLFANYPKLGKNL